MTSASIMIIGRDSDPVETVYVSMPHGMALASLMDDLALFSKRYPDITLNLQLGNYSASLGRREANVFIRAFKLSSCAFLEANSLSQHLVIDAQRSAQNSANSMLC
ncbi:hypothetical protein APB76_06785 [Vibrio bivalvicida]|uniref:Uncharacterized protein n=1 Tax=Vibrio bivalvicida TaxID=1276888 RepID=A0A177Y276_9VIBR|nr:hypothetical protein APB76_06785 [Vibrio bivalvicida]